MSTFIGREQDLTALHGYLQDALHGKGKVVFIIGEAGIGKTRLIEEFKAQCLDRLNKDLGKKTPEIRFADAKCNELAGKGEPYAPFFEIIAQFVADDKAFGSSKLAEIVREVGSDWFELVPVIGKALALISKTFFKWRKTDDVRQLADRQVQKDKLVQEFTHILKRMSDEHPLVLFLDDLHWADDSSISLLFHIARHLQEQRMLMLGTYRPTDIEGARGDKAHPLKDVVYELHRYDLCATINLGYLTNAYIRDFLDAYLGQHDLDAAFVDYLHDLTEGNPLFVTEYVKLLQEIDKLALCTASVPLATNVDQIRKRDACAAGVWTLRGTLHDADMPIPTSVEKVIEKRVERLKEELQKTLKYASVNGEQFNTLVLAKLLNWDELELLEKLEALSRVHQLVKEIELAPGQTPRGAVYQFIHSLVQKSLYATLSAGIKSKLHAKAAEILEEVYQDDLESVAAELVEHYSRGQNYAQAAKYALLAARKANRQSGFQEACAHAQRGLELLKMTSAKTPDQTMVRLQIELLIELATAEEAIGEAKNSIDHAETAAKLVERVNDQSFQGEVFYQVGRLLLENRGTNLERVIQFLERSIMIKIKTKDHESFERILENLHKATWGAGKVDDFIKYCTEIIYLNEETKKTYLNIEILNLIGKVFFDQGKHQEAYNKTTEGLNISLNVGNVNVQMKLFQQAIEYAICLGDHAKAAKHYEDAKTIALALKDMDMKDLIFSRLGRIAWHVNKQHEAIEYFLIAKDAAHKRGNLQSEAMILSEIEAKYRALGMFDEAIRFASEYLAIAEKIGKESMIENAFIRFAFTFRRQGNHFKALEADQQAVILARKSGRERMLAEYLSYFHEDLRLAGRFKEAIESLKESLDLGQKIKDIHREMNCLMHLAICHFLIGHVEKALPIMNQAVLLNQKTLNRKRDSIALSMRYSFILIGTGAYRNAYAILENVTEEGMKRRDWGGDFPLHFFNSAKLHLAFDNLEKALERLTQIDEYLKNNIFLEHIAMLKDAYAQVYLVQGEFDKAETSLNEAIALFQQMNSFRRGEADLTLAALRLAQGQPDVALQAAEDARKIFQEIEYYRRGEAILWEARCHLALRHFPETRERLAAANAIFTRQQQPHHAAEAKLVEGQLLLAETGDKTQALALFTEAQATFAKLGLKRLEKEAERLITSP